MNVSVDTFLDSRRVVVQKRICENVSKVPQELAFISSMHNNISFFEYLFCLLCKSVPLTKENVFDIAAKGNSAWSPRHDSSIHTS